MNLIISAFIFLNTRDNEVFKKSIIKIDIVYGFYNFTCPRYKQAAWRVFEQSDILLHPLTGPAIRRELYLPFSNRRQADLAVVVVPNGRSARQGRQTRLELPPCRQHCKIARGKSPSLGIQKRALRIRLKSKLRKSKTRELLDNSLRVSAICRICETCATI